MQPYVHRKYTTQAPHIVGAKKKKKKKKNHDNYHQKRNISSWSKIQSVEK